MSDSPKPDPKSDARKLGHRIALFPCPSPIRAKDQFTLFCTLVVVFGSLVGYLIYTINGKGIIELESAEKQSATFQVDLNTASWHEIAQLPGIGEVIARNIVQYREQYGGIRSLESLATIHGISDEMAIKLQPFVAPLPVAFDVAER